VISVCGEDDGHLEVAMASIINKTCGDEDNPEICKKFRYRAWVKLRHPFSEQEFIFCLLAQLCTNYCLRHGSAQDFMKLNDLRMVTEGVQIEELAKQVMSDQRYLVFLDDVHFKEDWDAVRKYLPDKKNGSCIVVHTQQRDVASYCVGQSDGILEMDLFSADHSVRVLFKEVCMLCP
jgi:hypothetical protein